MYLRRIFALLIIGLLLFSFFQWADASPKVGIEAAIIRETEQLIPLSIQMIDQAIEHLNKEPGQMNPEVQKIFNEIFEEFC